MSEGASFVLSGDADPLQKTLQTAMDGFTGLASKVQGVFLRPFDTLAKGVYGVFSSIASRITGTFSAIKDVVGGMMPLFMADLRSGLQAGFQEFSNTETALFRVENAIRATGAVAGYTTDQLKDLADAMEDATVFGDDLALSAQAVLLQFKNIRADVFKGALGAAADLAAATGMDLVGAADKLGRALDDPIRGIRVLRSEGIKFTADEIDMIEQMVLAGQVMQSQRFMLERLSGTFGGAAEAEAKTFTGQMKQLNNALGDQWKAIASALVPAIQAVIPLIKASANFTEGLATRFAELVEVTIHWAQTSPMIREWAESFMRAVKSAATWMMDRMTEAFTLVQTLVTNFPEAFKSAVATAKFYWESFAQWVKRTWGETVNAVSDAWAVGVEKMTMSVMKFVVNSLIEIRKFRAMMGALDPFGSLMSGMPSATGLEAMKRALDGGKFPGDQTFKLKGGTKPLGKPAHEPILTADDEKRLNELRKEMDKAAEGFGNKFGKNLQANKDFVDGVKKRMGDFFTELTGDGPNSRVKPKQSKDEFTFDKDDAGKSAFEDLFSLQKRIAGSAFKSPEQQATVQQTQVIKQLGHEQIKQQKEQQKKIDKQIEATEKIDQSLKDIADNFGLA